MHKYFSSLQSYKLHVWLYVPVFFFFTYINRTIIPFLILLLIGHFVLNMHMFMSLASGVSLPYVPFTEAAEDRYSGSLYPHPIIT